jgi:hypothetical protein
MSATPHSTDDDRYADLALEDGSVVIYDPRNPSAWLQSDAAVATESRA